MKRLFVDLEKCDSCSGCVVNCASIYHPQGASIVPLREYAIFSTICRRCEDAPCISSCYRNALAKDENGFIKRGRFLCTGCKTCSIACPFGVILPDFLTYIDTSCTYLATSSALKQISLCPQHAVEVKEIDSDDRENGIYIVSDVLAVQYRKWFKDDTILYKKGV